MSWKQHVLATALAASSLAAADVQAQVQSFDYVIVGAGTCGLTVANRLSEDPKVTVAIIDPGSDERGNIDSTDPARWIQTLGSAIDWKYPTVAQTDVNNRTLVYSAGKGIGGTSLINGMTYIRGDRAQFNAWEKLGNTGWNWDLLFDYYKKVERFTPPTAAQTQAGASYDPKYHGTSGPLHVGFPYSLQNGTLEPTVAQAWGNLSLPVNKDANGGTTFGFDVWPQTLDRDTNRRWDSATAYYWPVSSRPNLKLINGTATKATWAGKTTSQKLPTVNGVEYVDANNKTFTIAAKKEVIVSAGSLRTPAFLESSGVGNPKILKQNKIPLQVDLPSVGENLQDQPNLNLFFQSTLNSSDANTAGISPYATFVTAHDLFGANTSAVAAETKQQLHAWAQRTAAASGNALNATALEKIYAIQHDLIFTKNVTLAEVLTVGSGNALLTVYIALLPFSRGSAHLSSTTLSALNTPLIDPKFFLIDHDLDVNVALGKLCAKYAQTSPVKEVIVSRVSPNQTTLPDNASDAQWAGYTKDAMNTNFHPIGTAAMMARELGGVVDPALKVYGTANLRVVDASAIPTQFSGHLTATLYAIAERAAEVIKSGS